MALCVWVCMCIKNIIFLWLLLLLLLLLLLSLLAHLQISVKTLNLSPRTIKINNKPNRQTCYPFLSLSLSLSLCLSLFLYYNGFCFLLLFYVYICVCGVIKFITKIILVWKEIKREREGEGVRKKLWCIHKLIRACFLCFKVCLCMCIIRFAFFCFVFFFFYCALFSLPQKQKKETKKVVRRVVYLFVYWLLLWFLA